MNHIIIESYVYRLAEDGVLEAAKISILPAEFSPIGYSERKRTPEEDLLIIDELKRVNALFREGEKKFSREAQRGMGRGKKEPLRPRANGKGSVNEYICLVCKKSIITLDGADGNPLDPLKCFLTRQCPGRLVAHAYQGDKKAEYQWRVANEADKNSKDDFVRAHAENKGLILEQLAEVKAA